MIQRNTSPRATKWKMAPSKPAPKTSWWERDERGILVNPGSQQLAMNIWSSIKLRDLERCWRICRYPMIRSLNLLLIKNWRICGHTWKILLDRLNVIKTKMERWGSERNRLLWREDGTLRSTSIWLILMIEKNLYAE